MLLLLTREGRCLFTRTMQFQTTSGLVLNWKEQPATVVQSELRYACFGMGSSKCSKFRAAAVFVRRTSGASILVWGKILSWKRLRFVGPQEKSRPWKTLRSGKFIKSRSRYEPVAQPISYYSRTRSSQAQEISSRQPLHRSSLHYVHPACRASVLRHSGKL